MSEEITKGSIVVVESRTWPGSNKPGGVARVTAVHHTNLDDSSASASKTKYDVAYVLGGKEKGIEEEYVRLQSSSLDDATNEGGGGGKKRRVGSSSSGTNTATTNNNMHVSTSTASLALSASPLQTPQLNDRLDNNTDGTKKEEEGSPVCDNDEQIMEERRKRKNSIQEDILMGDSRNSSYNSLGGAVDGMEPIVKKRKMESEGEETSRDDDDSAASSSSLHRHHKTAIWSARKHLEIKVKKSSNNNNSTATLSNDGEGNSNQQVTLKRWRSHQIAEDYINLASALVLPPTHYLHNNTPLTFGYSPHLGQYPIEQVTALGYLTSPLRRPTVIEKWSPYEITTFEAALALHGKHFHQVQKWVKTKNTKEIIEFYYIWKKSSHYRRWKGSYVEEMESVCSSDDSGGEEEKGEDEVMEGGMEKKE